MKLKCEACGKIITKLWKNIDFEHADRVKYCSRKCYLSQFEQPLTGEVKECSKCHAPKDTSLFLKRYSKGREGQLGSWCKECFCTNQMVQWNALKIEIVMMLGNKCSVCTETFHPAAYDLHHTDPDTKSFDWSGLRKKSKSVILEEVSKCVLICAACHRLNHVNHETWRMAQAVYDERRVRDSNSQNPFGFAGIQSRCLNRSANSPEN